MKNPCGKQIVHPWPLTNQKTWPVQTQTLLFNLLSNKFLHICLIRRTVFPPDLLQIK